MEIKPKAIKIIFEKDGKKYIIPKTDHCLPYKNLEEKIFDWNWYSLLEGNYSCDCNRSLIIKQFYPEFIKKYPEYEFDSEFFRCINTIKLIKYEIIE